MIEVKGLTKYYGSICAVRDVSFDVSQGEIVGFLGPNGAGKTTTMRILTGFSPATSGHARIAGFDIAENPLEVKRRVGYLPESVPLYPEMRVTKFLSYVASIKGLVRSEQRLEVGRVVERCGLELVSGRVIGNLSKGYRQRVGLAQALIGNPPVLVFDEPTVGLDPKQIVEIRQTIKELAEEHTVLLSTHILPEVAMLCERVIIINQGRIVAKDTMANLRGGKDERVLELQVSGETAEAARLLEKVEGVKGVAQGVGGALTVTTRGDGSIAEVISKALIEGGFGLVSLQERSRTLEDIFLEAISSEEGWDADSAQGGS